jgi:uncharacterized protein (DUF58 family)
MGDTIERIDWRQSAKGDRLYIRETEWAAAQSVYLWRDTNPGMNYRSSNSLPTKQDRCELLLLALGALLVRGGERIALLGGRGPASGKGALNAVLSGLGLDTPLSAVDRTVPRHATLILLSDFLEPVEEIGPALERIAGGGAAVELVQVLDPAEIALSFNGRVRFREMATDAPSDSDALIPRVESVRTAYRQALAQQQDALSELARRHGWNFMVHSTDTPPEQPVRVLHTRLAAKAGGGSAP